MYSVQFKIIHDGCWGSQINLKFPKHSFASIDCHWSTKEVRHLLRVRGDSKEFTRIKTFLKNFQDVISVKVVSENEQNMYLHIPSKGKTKFGQFSDVFFENGLFPTAAVQFVGNEEIWTLGSTDKKSITKVHTHLEKNHKVTIAYCTEKKEVSEFLTDKQREAVQQASYFGYYDWPREKSVTEICEILKIPKTVFLSHLRKAEQKIIKHFLEEKEIQ